MGVEVYLFTVVFREAVDTASITMLLTAAGASERPPDPFDESGDARNRNFEVRSGRGLTEIQVRPQADRTAIRKLSVRFSVLSSASVIEQTFGFLQELDRRKALDLFDHEHRQRRIPLDPVAFCRNRWRIRKRHLICNNENGLVIEGGMESWNYIVEHQLMSRFLGAPYLSSRFRLLLRHLRAIFWRWLPAPISAVEMSHPRKSKQSVLSSRLRKIVDALPLKAGMRVLEIGCGPGALAREMAVRVDPGFVLGIDRSEKAIAQAKAAATDFMESGTFHFLHVPIDDFVLPSGMPPFDLAVAIRIGALDGRHPELAESALTPIAAALKPDGELFIDKGDLPGEIPLKAYRSRL